MTINCLLHVHSSFSYDSKTDLADIARTAREHGFSCVLMSEHNNFMDAAAVSALVQRCQELSDDTLLIVPGLELAFDNNSVHLLAYGVREYISSTSPGCTFASLVRSVRDAGGVAVLAHPSHRNAMERVSAEDMQTLDGVEIWNVKNGNRFVPTASELRLHQRLRNSGAPVFAYAGVDWHHLTKFAPVVVAVDAPTLTRESVLDHLRLGHFEVRGTWASVASTGEARQRRIRLYAAAGQTVTKVRKTAYRWQSALERRGFKTPRFVAAVARRVWS
jgi:predicted metal-dependent phosphoesterase TrpH